MAVSLHGLASLRFQDLTQDCIKNYALLNYVKILRDHLFISGFLYEKPLETLPAVTHCGEALCVRGHQVSPHRHSGFELLYLSRGSTTWQAGGPPIRQQMGDLVIFHPDEPHATLCEASEETHQLWIGLELDKLGAEGRRLASSLRKKKSRLLGGCQGAEPILRAIVGQIARNLPGQREVVLAYLQVLFAILGQQIHSLRPDKTAPRMPSLPYSYAVQKAILHMENHLDRRISLTELAAVATVRHTPQFCTQFRREVGMTPAANHLQLRLNAARAALRQPAFNITLAALQFGFNSSQHFSTVFRRTFGMTPRQWQKGPGNCAT